MARHVRFPAAGHGEAEPGAPAPDRVLEGEPRFCTWNCYESPDGRTFCGVWEATPGKWRVAYDEWESCTLLEGRSIVTPDGGDPVLLGPGDTMILEPGFAGTWHVVETTRKTYVIHVQSAQPIERVQSAQPIERVQSAQPIERVQSAQLIERAQSAQPIDRV